jgi:hypothetical protein
MKICRKTTMKLLVAEKGAQVTRTLLGRQQQEMILSHLANYIDWPR